MNGTINSSPIGREGPARISVRAVEGMTQTPALLNYRMMSQHPHDTLSR